ncbi:carbohydrate ABC transporter permease [Halorarum halophilum]|uniref:Carbohydrate ABC transporter permease n=1 Tax=Halorarum halophilum TaxID=2743090 RepID=A0A7D5GLA8_9EURY|nr:carbohydrate ABC transporter permease [Halobaculum halophilum]QLG27867.1 carbohydrate ABC transporter permease [Halobaculum halophilum]
MSSDTAGPYERWVQDSIQNPKKVYRAMFVVVAGFFLFTTLFPLYWLLVLALTPEENMSDVGLLPNGFNPEVFLTVFEQVPFHWYMFNSIVLGLITTVIVLVLASVAGYVFGRLEFPGRVPLMLLLLAVSYFPPAAFLLPLFRLFTGNVTFLTLPGGEAVQSPVLFNTPGALVFPYSALFLPLSIFVLTTFYSQIPDGLEKAARVEGTTRLGALFRVIMPLSAPGVATAGVLTFISVYNEFFFGYLMTDGQAQNWAPVVWGILQFQGQYADLYNLMAAASIIGVVPIAILVVVAQEKIVSGLTAGALKE